MSNLPDDQSFYIIDCDDNPTMFNQTYLPILYLQLIAPFFTPDVAPHSQIVIA